MSYRVYCQEWEESERGWGVRPDGFTLHRDEAAHKAHLDEIYAERSNTVPDCYSRPAGDPVWIQVNQETYDRAQRDGIVHVHHWSSLRDVLDPKTAASTLKKFGMS